MTLGEFVKILYEDGADDEMEIYYQDMNFGGPDRKLNVVDFRVVDGKILLDSLYWEELD